MAKAQTPVNVAATTAVTSRDQPVPQGLANRLSAGRTKHNGRQARWAADGTAQSHPRPNRRPTDANDQLTRLNERLTQVGEARARFFANVTHEMRTPLALILGPVEKHLRESAEMDAGLRRDLEVVQRNARTVLRHVNDLLDVARLEAGRVPVDYATTDVSAVARAVSRQFSALAEEQHFEFVVETPARLVVEIDADKLGSITVNLLSNAFKYTPAGGRVRMTVRDSGQRFQLEVADSGPGIPADRRQAVFDRFERLDSDDTHRHGGTGLGLSIVRDFAKLLGGTVSVGEAPEGGALFVLDLPCAAPLGTAVRPVVGNAMPAYAADDVIDELRQARVTTPAPRAATGTAGRVLVVEDSQDMNRFIANCLSGDGFAVSAALDGVQGYERASTDRPDLVVTDIVMPRMRGDELIRRLRQRPDFRSTPILVLGATGGDQFRVRPQRGDVQGYLDKPFSVDELRERVRDLVAQKRAGEQAATVPRRLDTAAAARYAILEAVASVPEVNLQMAFQTIALEAQNLTAATYAALAIGGHVEHPFDVWAVTGLGAEERKTVGRHPGPVGLLGLVGKESKAIEMRSFLGAPIRCDGHDIGYVYLASKRGAADFTDEDQRSIDALAARTGAAIHSARPYAADGQAWLQAVIEQMTDGVELMDRDGHVTLANRPLRSIAPDGAATAGGSADRGADRGAITLDLREPSGMAVAADDLPIAKAIASQQITCRRELFARRHDGTLLPLHVSAAPIFMSDGTCTGAAMVVREITPLKEHGRVHSSWTPAAAPLPIGVIAPRRSIARAQAADRGRPKNGGKSAPRRRG